MTIDLHKLKTEVRAELDGYPIPPPVHPQAVGSPLPASWFEAGLTEMRSSLVEPYLAEAVWFDRVANKRISRPVAIVADDNQGHVVALDIQGDEFELLRRADGSLLSLDVRGDAVGCFLAR